MKKRLFALALALVLAFSLLPAVFAAEVPAESHNRGAQSYHDGIQWRWSDTVKSYLYPSGSGLCRVEYIRSGDAARLVAEDYSAAGKLQSQRELTMELPIFGGFFAGADANYIVFGQAQSTKTGNDAEEVVRVVKYSKRWQRLGDLRIRGENTITPFSAGSLRCAEDGGYLYIHTCHEMYQSKDGYNHQANLTIVVKESDMTAADVRSSVMNEEFGYVSHSFNQFILVDGGNVVTLDHGDACARGAYLYRFPVKADGQCLPGFYNGRIGEGVYLMTFREAGENEHYNATGAGLGGLAASATHYIAAGQSIDQTLSNVSLDRGQRNIFVSAVPKDSFAAGSVKTYWLTRYSADAENTTYVSTPHLVALRDGRSLVLWTEGTNTLCYQFLKADGSPEGKVYRRDGALSDCVPVEADCKVVWYVTTGGTPVFDSIDLEHPEQTPAPKPTWFSDVPANAYFADPVAWAVERGVTQGTGGNRFSPNADCTRAQIVTFLWRAAGSPDPESSDNPFRDVKPADYFYKAVLWAVEQNITQGTGANTFSPGDSCTRAQAVTFLWRAKGQPEISGSTGFGDVPASAYYAQAVLWAVQNGVTQGTGGNKFSPNATCTRAQIVTFLYRAEP